MLYRSRYQNKAKVKYLIVCRLTFSPEHLPYLWNTAKKLLFSVAILALQTLWKRVMSFFIMYFVIKLNDLLLKNLVQCCLGKLVSYGNLEPFFSFASIHFFMKLVQKFYFTKNFFFIVIKVASNSCNSTGRLFILALYLLALKYIQSVQSNSHSSYV